MTQTTDEAAAPRRGFTARRGLQVVMAAQIAIAAALVAVDVQDHDVFAPDRPPRANPAPTLRPAAPVAPGDQRRRYTPAFAPDADARPIPPGPLRFGADEAAGIGAVMTVEGAIGPGDSVRFRDALARAEATGDAPVAISLHSPGGSLQDALAIGRAIRAAGLSTLVPAGAICFSACPTVLFGGVERRVSRKAWIGMHQSYLADVSFVTTRRAVADVQSLQGEIIAFAREGGVDPAVHVHALTTPPEEMYVLVEAELTEYRAATALID